jgi:hypothetical protein
MMKNRWRKARRRSSDGNSSSIGFSSASSGSFDSTSGEFNSDETFVNKLSIRKGCLKGQDDILKQYHTKMMASKQQLKKRKFVTFQSVFIREYERTVGDNPSCSRGAPVR